MKKTMKERLERFRARGAQRRGAAIAALRRPAGGIHMPVPELKAIDTALSTAVNTTTGATLLNASSRGSDIADHVGRRVQLRSVQYRGVVYVTAGTGVDQVHRVVLVYDKHPNGVAPTYTDVYGGVGTSLQPSIANSSRFQILSDKYIALNATGEPGSYKTVSFYRKLNHPVVFNSSNAGTIADITDGALYLMYSGSIAAGATAGTISVNCRVRFTDE